MQFIMEKNIQILANIFHHGAKENMPIFCGKFFNLEFLGIDNLHKRFGVDILKIEGFFYG